MDTREEFQRYMTAISGEEDRLRRHLSEEELIEYQHGRLQAIERDEIQSHLVQCDACIAVLKQVSDFFEPAREGEEAISDVEIGREWKTCWQRIQTEERDIRRAQRFKRAGFWLNPRVAYAVAASLIVAVGLTGAWALWLRQEKQQVVARLQAEQASWSERRSALERDNRQLQEQARALEQSYESQLAELRQPQVNARAYDIYSRAFIQRSADESEVNRINLPPATTSFILILNGEGQPAYPDYVIELMNQNGERVWRNEELRRDSSGNFPIKFDRTFLSQGKYTLKLYGQTGRRTKRIAEYAISVE